MCKPNSLGSIHVRVFYSAMIADGILRLFLVGSHGILSDLYRIASVVQIFIYALMLVYNYKNQAVVSFKMLDVCIKLQAIDSVMFIIHSLNNGISSLYEFISTLMLFFLIFWILSYRKKKLNELIKFTRKLQETKL